MLIHFQMIISNLRRIYIKNKNEMWRTVENSLCVRRRGLVVSDYNTYHTHIELRVISYLIRSISGMIFISIKLTLLNCIFFPNVIIWCSVHTSNAYDPFVGTRASNGNNN